jgi:hypothetical protein
MMEASCMAFVRSGAAQEAFRLLMQAQRGTEIRKERKEFRHGNESEKEKIRLARKKGLSWRKLGTMFDRSPRYCQDAVNGPIYKKTK